MTDLFIILLLVLGVSLAREVGNFTTIKSLEKYNSFLRTVLGVYVVKYGKIEPSEVIKIITGGEK